MKKLLAKDKKIRNQLELMDKNHLILKSIFKNLNFSTLIRWKAFENLNTLSKNINKNVLSNRCLHSINKKRFSKLTNFSRHTFLKLIRNGRISGLKKTSW